MKNKILALISTLVLGVALVAAPVTASNDKVTICHAAGQAGTTKYVTLTISKNAVYKEQGGHFYENGTPRAGHEEDYLGPCLTTSPSQTPKPTATTTPPPTESPSGTPTPSESPSPTPTTSPTPSISPTPTPEQSPSVTPSPSLTPTPSAEPTPRLTLPPTDTSPEVTTLANVATSALIVWIALTIAGAVLALFMLLYILRKFKE